MGGAVTTWARAGGVQSERRREVDSAPLVKACSVEGCTQLRMSPHTTVQTPAAATAADGSHACNKMGTVTAVCLRSNVKGLSASNMLLARIRPGKVARDVHTNSSERQCCHSTHVMKLDTFCCKLFADP